MLRLIDLLCKDHPDFDQALIDLVDNYLIEHPDIDSLFLGPDALFLPPGTDEEEAEFPNFVNAPIPW